MAVPVGPWVDLMDLEYLRLFVPGSGAAVKFAISGDETLSATRERFSALAADQDYAFVSIDAAATKLHLIQEFFFALAREIDWEALAQQKIEALFREHNYVWPLPGSPVALSKISSANNGIAESLILNNVDQWLSKAILRDPDMTHDFREAMTHLCRRRLDSGEASSVPIIEWLRGELRLLSAIRPVPIGAKVTRHNGRAMLRSLCHWLALCKRPGMLVLLDVRWMAERNTSPAGIRFAPAAVLDVFEVLRQLIDETERLEGLFLVVVAGPALLEGEDVRRTLDKYPALKDRIGFDVRAEQHDNPVAPLVRLVPDVNGPRIRPGGAMPFSTERVAIEALRAGVPNEAAIRLLRRPDDPWCDAFVEQLRTYARAAGDPPLLPGHIVFGGFGTGKSHLLGYLAEHARNQNFIVSVISISKETPLFNLDRVYTAAIRNAVVPGINDDAMSVVIGRLDGQSPEFRALNEWASSPASGLSPIFPALLHVLAGHVLGPEEKTAIARFFSGARIGTGKIGGWLRASGARQLFPIRPVKAAELALQRLRFAPALFRAVGFSGWCVLLDEAELIGRYSTLQRGKSYAELCRWLGLEKQTAIPGLIAVAALVDDFKSVVLHGRLDEERIPALLEAKGLTEQLRMAEIGMRAIEKETHALATPDTDRLQRDLKIVKGLYGRSYDWVPTSTEIGERRAGKTVRAYIKSWITDWDIQRLYGEKDTIVSDSTPPDLSEDKAFETPAPEPPEEEV